MRIKIVYDNDIRKYNDDHSLERIDNFVKQKYGLDSFKVTYLDDEDDD